MHRGAACNWNRCRFFSPSLQSVAALQGGSPAVRERFRVVVSPFAKRTLAPVVEEFGRLRNDEAVVELIETSVFDIAGSYDRLDERTLYVLDLPLELDIIANDLPAGFLAAVLGKPGFFRPFFCAPLGKRVDIRWQSEYDTTKQQSSVLA